MYYRGVEEYNQGYIVYSLGNFIFDKWQTNPRETMILDCDITAQSIDMDFVPVFIDKSFRPHIARGKRSKDISLKMRHYSDQISEIWDAGDAYDGSEYEKNAAKAYNKFRISSYLYFLRNMYRYSPKVLKQSIVRSFFRRLGKD